MNISEVPYVTVPSRIREIIEDKDAIRDLLAAPGASMKGVRDQVILVLLYDTAIRADELISLNLSDVNASADEPYLRIHGKGDKEKGRCNFRESGTIGGAVYFAFPQGSPETVGTVYLYGDQRFDREDVREERGAHCSEIR